MAAFFFILGLFQCAVIWCLGRIGAKITARGAQEHALARFEPPQGWLPCALIVSAGGDHPRMEEAMISLAAQNYPDFVLCVATATQDEPAAIVARRLQEEFPNVEHVVAGKATACGQKNYNLLAAVKHIGERAEIYAFCDSTHLARPDFLRCLTGPIVRKETAFTTGYHVVEPQDNGIITLAYAISALFMRFLQAVPGLAQPWGGAMAMSRAAFATADVAGLWANNVVDDCSLAALLAEIGIKPRLCPGALLLTVTGNHPFSTWRHWLERQILFLKFCMPSQWTALGIVCVVMALPPAWFLWTCLRGILGVGGGLGPFLALCWLLVLWFAVGTWRQYIAPIPAISRWLMGFFCASFTFVFVYISTFGSRTLLWNNILYHVGPGGRVMSLERPLASAHEKNKNY